MMNTYSFLIASAYRYWIAKINYFSILKPDGSNAGKSFAVFLRYFTGSPSHPARQEKPLS